MDVVNAQVQEALVPTDTALFFHATDKQDPRLGDLVRTRLDDVRQTKLVAVVLGVPQHLGVMRNNGRPGAAEAPTAIRAMLYRMATSAIQSAIDRNDLAVVDIGNINVEGLSLEEIHHNQHQVVMALLKSGMFPIVLGGGHDCVWPTINAYESVGVSYGVMNIDAHADVRPLIDGHKAHSGSPFRQMLEVDSSCRAEGAFVEYGLQHYAVAKAHVDYVRSRHAHVFMLEDARQPGAWTQAMDKLGSAKRVHISLDMDGFASAFAPGVSAPSPDGFYPSEIGPRLRESARTTMNSFDVVEVCPPLDTDNRTAKLGASMIMHVLAGIADRFTR